MAREIVDAGFDDIRPAHSSVFQHIRPEGSRVSELADSAQMTKQSMSYLVNDLERRGYVARERDPDDGRAVRIALTGRGWDQVLAAAQVIEEVEREWEDLLGSDRMRELRSLLEGLLAELVGVPPEPTVDDVARGRIRPAAKGP